MTSRFLNAALWLLVFLLPVKFGGLIIMPDRPETFVDWWLGRWPAEIAIAGVLLWVALALFCRRRRKEAESRADVHPPFQEPDPASDGKAAEDCRTPRRSRDGEGSFSTRQRLGVRQSSAAFGAPRVPGRDAPTSRGWVSPFIGGHALVWLLLLWLAVQWLAAAFSPWPSRAVPVAIFFTATVAFFWIGSATFVTRTLLSAPLRAERTARTGVSALRDGSWQDSAADADQRYWQLLGALTAGTIMVCGIALHQYFIAFPQTLRDAADAANALSPEVRERLPDLMAKLRQGRVFGTLFYPNALAGFLILVGPPACCWLWLYLRQRLEGGERLVRAVSVIAAVMLAGAMLWCLLLTKSKGGFLMLALALAAGLIFCRPIPTCWRVGVLATLVSLGAVWFGAAGLRRGLETIEARGDYWRAGLTMIAEQPWLGSGPGTFGLRYVKHRQAEAEWTRLAHNNYLQQWTDSGVVGFASFAALWAAVLWLGAPRSRRHEEADGFSDGTPSSSSPRETWQADRRLRAEAEFDRLACRNSVTRVTELRTPAETDFDWLAWATWVGLAAWALHNLVDFDLYIAAIAWPAFLMAGWMVRETVGQTLLSGRSSS